MIGEVKASKQEQFPPNILYGRSGMIHQIDKLAADLKVINTLLKWLLPRCKNTDYETYFNVAVTFYFNSGNKAVTLFGVLIRDTSPTENDLNGRGKTLGETIPSPTTCILLGLYLPCKIAQLPEIVKGVLKWIHRGSLPSALPTTLKPYVRLDLMSPSARNDMEQSSTLFRLSINLVGCSRL